MKSPNVLTSPAEFGALIKKVRKEHKVTQAQLAFVSGVGIRVLRELENGKPTTQFGKVLQVLTALGGELTVRWRNDRS